MALAQPLCQTQPLCHAPRRPAFQEFVALLQEWRRRARSRRELAALCDRCLRDIGVTHNDAYREIRKPFWRA